MEHLATNDEVYLGHQEKRPRIDGCFEDIPDEVIPCQYLQKFGLERSWPLFQSLQKISSSWPR